MLFHGVTFKLGSAKVCSPAIFEIYFVVTLVHGFL